MYSLAANLEIMKREKLNTTHGCPINPNIGAGSICPGFLQAKDLIQQHLNRQLLSLTSKEEGYLFASFLIKEEPVIIGQQHVKIF